MTAQPQLELVDEPRPRSATEKYLEFFADWRKRFGRPHRLEEAWKRDNASAIRELRARQREESGQ